jgi:uncharacterized protein (TIGR00304 family)
MNKYHAGAVLCLILAIVFLAMSIQNDEGAVHLFLIFPVITINSLYSGLGALFVFLTFILFFIGFAAGYELVGWDEISSDTHPPTRQGKADGQQGRPAGSKRTSIKGGGVVLIGPIPIIFGSDQKLTVILAVLALAIMVVAFLFIFYNW